MWLRTEGREDEHRRESRDRGGVPGGLPLLTFAATSPLVNRTAQRHGSTRVLAFSENLPGILHDRGTSGTAAGWHLFLAQVVGLVASSLLPVLARRGIDQRVLAAGACLVLALTFQRQRAADAAQAAALAGMAQAVGYLVAAGGPLLLGLLHDVTGGWTLPLVVLVAVTSAQAVVGLFAGRDRRLTRS